MSSVKDTAATYQTLSSFNSAMWGACGYPSRTVRGMYQQEQQIAKADEAGLIVTAADIADCKCPVCGWGTPLEQLLDHDRCLVCLYASNE